MLIKDLEKHGILAINLGQGTFDIHVEGVGLLEIKKLGKWNPAYHEPTVEFGGPQTQAMRRIFHFGATEPLVVVFGENPERYYKLDPKAVVAKVKSRKKFPVIWITESRLKIPAISRFSSYKALLESFLEAQS